MESTASGSGALPEQKRLAFGDEPKQGERTERQQPSVSSDSKLYPKPLDGVIAPVPSRKYAPGPAAPRWPQRVWLIIFVVFCVELGMLLVVLPWTPLWNDNYLLLNFPKLRALAQWGFVRGAITGLGVVDIWLGIGEAVRQHRRTKR